MKALSNYKEATEAGKPKEVGAADQYFGVAARNLRRIRLGPALRSHPHRGLPYLHETPPCCGVGSNQFRASQSYGRHAGQLQHAHRNVTDDLHHSAMSSSWRLPRRTQKNRTPVTGPWLLQRNEQQWLYWEPALASLN